MRFFCGFVPLGIFPVERTFLAEIIEIFQLGNVWWGFPYMLLLKNALMLDGLKSIPTILAVPTELKSALG